MFLESARSMDGGSHRCRSECRRLLLPSVHTLAQFFFNDARSTVRTQLKSQPLMKPWAKWAPIPPATERKCAEG